MAKGRVLKQITAAQSMVGEKARTGIKGNKCLSVRRTQRDQCKDRTAGGAIWKKRDVNKNNHWAIAPKERDAK